MTTALILTSNSLRHMYFANVMARALDVTGIISEPKSDYFERQIEGSSLVKEHFANLSAYERKYLGDYPSFPEVPTLFVKTKEINEAATLDWARDRDADVVLLFGTGILSDAWLDEYEGRVVNLHLGFSPRYRGTATLFWPFVNDELEYVGATIHLAERRVDAGAILKVVTPDIAGGDNYYDISSKTIRKAIDSMPAVVNAYLARELAPIPQNKAEQKYCYYKKDFSEDVLRGVMEKYGP
jgi:methionyl-tRNA formyltransferase